MSDQTKDTLKKQAGIAALLARIFWGLIGNMVLGISIAGIVINRLPFLHPVDFIYLITLAALIIVRYIDIMHWQGTTIMGTPATKQTWNEYAYKLVAIGLLAWVFAHLTVYMVNKNVTTDDTFSFLINFYEVHSYWNI